MILIGWEDNLFSDWRTLGRQAPSPYASAGHPLEEERRIGYVMEARARDCSTLPPTASASASRPSPALF